MLQALAIVEKIFIAYKEVREILISFIPLFLL